MFIYLQKNSGFQSAGVGGGAFVDERFSSSISIYTVRSSSPKMSVSDTTPSGLPYDSSTHHNLQQSDTVKDKIHASYMKNLSYL